MNNIKTSFQINNRKVGENFKPLVIAEIGINHNGNLKEAIKLADDALLSGAEVIKHQTHIPDDEMSEEAKEIIPEHTEDSIYEIIRKCSLSENDEYKLMTHITKKGGIYISTPFSKLAVDRLVKFNVPAFKIGSGECNNYPLVEYIAKNKKPIILSTGMNSIETIKPSVEIFRKYDVPYALLHCTNIYPTPPELVRLDAIQKMKDAFPDAIIGLSDHTTSIFTCLGAVAIGACILEKHFTDTKTREGPDIEASMDIVDLKMLIEGSNVIFKAKGSYKGPIPEENSTINFAFASIVATKDIDEGELITENNIFPRRPGGGDYPSFDYYNLLGKRTKNKIKVNSRIKKTDII